ncbi:Uncharacterized protein SCF082_LOCUS15521 [Durusdinium trenchii]|uniref:Uncharacterized protein n=1 Tax=Durusdinium trenchii TaxID=1381693 RepID=A0ABP0K4Y3_9DINO
MDNWSFLVTLLCAYAAIAWHLRLPDVLEAWKNFLTKAPVPGADLTVQSRLQEFRQNAMPNWVPIFTKTGEVYLLVWVLLRLSVPEAWTKPACEDMHMWSLVVSLVGLRLVCQPDAHSSKWQRRFMSTTFSIASMLSQVETRYMMNDILTSIFIYLILQHIDFLLGKLLRTTIDLEDQVQERKETDDLLAAARRLLSVTCDCCEQLTDRLEMVEPSQNTLAMLQIKNPEEDARNAMSLPFLQFICTEDQDRFSQFIAASDSQAPSSLHLRMQTCKGAPFEASNVTKVNQKYLAQVFHVNVPQSTLGCSHWHLIGISKSAAAEMTSIPEHCTVDPSPFIPLLSAPRPRSRRSVSSGSRSAAASTSSGASSEWSSSAAAAQLDRSIKEIQLHLGPVDFGVSSVNIVFHDAKTMNIMNWISTKSASAVQGFIQHHLNSWHHAERSTDICKRVKFRAPGTRSAFVAQMSMGEIEGEPGEGDPRKMRLDLKGVVFR